LSDGAGITCRPYETVKLEQLQSFLQRVLSQEPINTIVVGHPITMGGGVSEQTKRVEVIFDQLKKAFEASFGSSIKWVLWMSVKLKRALQHKANGSCKIAKRKAT